MIGLTVIFLYFIVPFVFAIFIPGVISLICKENVYKILGYKAVFNTCLIFALVMCIIFRLRITY